MQSFTSANRATLPELFSFKSACFRWYIKDTRANVLNVSATQASQCTAAYRSDVTYASKPLFLSLFLFHTLLLFIVLYCTLPLPYQLSRTSHLFHRLVLPLSLPLFLFIFFISLKLCFHPFQCQTTFCQTSRGFLPNIISQWKCQKIFSGFICIHKYRLNNFKSY